MLGLIDLDTGNLASLESALKKLNIKYKVCRNSFDFEKTDKIILPGVGAFADFMKKIEERGFKKIILNKINNKIPFLGVCVGFQVLFSESMEHGHCKGLNVINGKIVNFNEFSKNIKVPHVGWNQCKIVQKNQLFNGIENLSDFYFTHSYIVKNNLPETTIAETEYEINFVSAVMKENVYGVQFHPEKSQLNGLKVLKNFYERC